MTQDALVEDVHFRLDWLHWRALGFRAAAVNLSDLAASARAGGAARHARRARLDAHRRRDRVLRGDRGSRRPRGRRRHDVGRPRRVSVTALGHSARVPGRAGARPGDLLVVTGPLGAAGAAFRAAALRAAAAAARGGPAARRDGARSAGHLRRDRRRRRAHRALLRRALRVDLDARSARARRDAR